MQMTKIPTLTIVILLLFKVAPPWADTWLDVTWILKLSNFGSQFSEFEVATYSDYLLATQDCEESQYKTTQSQWVRNNITVDKYLARRGRKSISKEEWDEIKKGRIVINNKAGYTSARCKKDYTQWAFVSIAPLLVCLLFTLLVWWREEEGWTRVLLLPVVLIGLYSQYRAIKIIIIGLGKWPNRRQEEWQEEKRKFTQRTVSIEPVTEALPSILIQVALLSTEIHALILGNRPNPLGDNPALFLANFGFSLLLTVMGLTHFLKDGPSPLISSSQGYLDGFLSKDYGALFLSTCLWFFAKGLILSFVIHSRGGPSLAGIELPNSVPVAFICWTATLVLPQLLYSFIVLAITTGWKVFSLVLSFPSFLITPLFTPFTYKASRTEDKFELSVSIRHTIINIIITFLLTPLTMVLYYHEWIWKYTYSFGPTAKQISVYQSNFNFWQEKNRTITADKQQDRFDLYTNYCQFVVLMFVFLPPLLLVLSLLPTCHLLRTCSCSCSCSCFGNILSCSCGNTNANKHRGKMLFHKIGKLSWQVSPEEEEAIEMVVVDNEDIEDQEAIGLLKNNEEHQNAYIKEIIDDILNHAIVLAKK